MKGHHFKRYLLSKLNSFYKNFIKLGHIVEYHDVFFKFNNGQYRQWKFLSQISRLLLEPFFSNFVYTFR